MKSFLRLFGLAVLIGLGIVILRALRQQRDSGSFEVGATTMSSSGETRRGISPELLNILADPGDKGPVELMTDGSGKEWLVNRRNGFRYPIEDGIPIMLLEEGEKHKDESLVQP
jgi:uncharacterized protein